MLNWFGKSGFNRKNSNSNQVRDSLISNVSSVTICGSDTLDSNKLLKERLKRYENETARITSKFILTDKTSYLRKSRENDISKKIINIENSMNVDLCFVLDCTGSMESHITAAKDHILKVAAYVNQNNSNIKFCVGFCGYRDYSDDINEHLQIFDFTNSYEKFKTYITSKVTAKGGDDIPEDVLGGLNAAITRMTWSNATRILIHIGDAPPHGRNYTRDYDKYPKGDPKGLTAKRVLRRMQSNKILYHFGKINYSTDTMINNFREIIGDFPIFNLKKTGGDPARLINKFCNATCSAIFSSVMLTTTLKNTKSIYSLQKEKLQINPREPDWSTLSIKSGELLSYLLPNSLDEIMDDCYFFNSNFTIQEISFKLAPQPFSVGAERYAYFAFDTDLGQNEKLVVKKYHDVKSGSIERYLESVEVSSIAHFLATKFNLATEKINIKKKVKFIDVKVLCDKTESSTVYYSVEKYFSDAKFKRFNVNSGIITEFHSILEAFAHFTYQYTDGYLVVYDLQGVDLENEFLLTDPAIHCNDLLRFGITNLGIKGIQLCFLANHKCNNICEKLMLNEVVI
ncbi:kinase-like protein [Gigaspora margarita]|uniref:Kinase-like protein n=1 Tax=Gigaspora margarita TaxID=4874 RepID=A0A8H4A699_GIGMA|nr:kinase-like protein [Gigaspora margarita]